MKLVGSKRAVRSPEFHKKQELKRKLRIGFIVVLSIIIFLSPVFILRSQSLLLSDIEVNGNGVTPTNEIEDLIRESMQGKYLGLIPRSSTLLYPKDKIIEELKNSIPRLSSVALSLSGISSVEVSVVERTPEALYCSDDSKCYFVDKTGLIYADAPNFSEGVYVTYKTEEALSLPIRKYLLTEEEISKNKIFLNRLSGLNIIPDTILIKHEEYSLKTKDGPRVLWRRKQDFDRLISDFDVFLKSAKLNQSKFKDISYFDLRVDNKIFYKYIGE